MDFCRSEGISPEVLEAMTTSAGATRLTSARTRCFNSSCSGIFSWMKSACRAICSRSVVKDSVPFGGSVLCTVVAGITGCALGTFFMAFHSTQGPQLGLPQMLQSRPQFGYTGALLVWAVALVAFIGFNAFNQVLAAQPLHQLSGPISPTSPTVIVVFA